MKNLKRVIAGMLMMIFLFSLAACGKNEEKGSEAKTTQSQDGAETSSGEQNDVPENTTGENGETAPTVPGQTTTKKNNVSNMAPAGPARTTPKMVDTVPGVSSTVGTTIRRTQDRWGNPTQAFIKSLEGFELKILNPWANPAVGTELYKSGVYIEQMVEALYKVNIVEDGFWEGYNDTVTASLSAGKPQAHIYRVQDFNYASYMSKKFMADLTSGMRTSGVDMKEPWYNQEVRQFLNMNKKQYGWIQADYYDPYLIYYNRDMVKAAKLTDPAKLAAAGTWTWDKLKEYSKKLTTSSRKGLVSGSQGMFLGSLVASNGGAMTTVTSAGEPTTNISNAIVKDALNTLGSWTKAKTVDFLDGGDWTAAKKAFGNNQAAMIHASEDAIRSAISTSFKGEIGVVPFPKGPKAGNTYNNMVTAQFIFFIPTQYAKDVAKILFIRNEMSRQGYCFSERDFVIEWRKYFSGDALDMLTNLRYAKGNYKVKYNWTTVCEKGSGAAITTNWIAYEVAAGTKTAQQAIDAYSSALAKEYSDIWKGYKITG